MGRVQLPKNLVRKSFFQVPRNLQNSLTCSQSPRHGYELAGFHCIAFIILWMTLRLSLLATELQGAASLRTACVRYDGK